MDPDANLERLLELANGVLAHQDAGGDHEDVTVELAEYVVALNDWLAKGGSLPKEWSKVAWSNGVTLAQAITLGGKVLPQDTMHVTMGGAGLGSDYLYVHYTNDPFVLGIDREGRGSS
jgi:hypothetical protein